MKKYIFVISMLIVLGIFTGCTSQKPLIISNSGGESPEVIEEAIIVTGEEDWINKWVWNAPEGIVAFYEDSREHEKGLLTYFVFEPILESDSAETVFLKNERNQLVTDFNNLILEMLEKESKYELTEDWYENHYGVELRNLSDIICSYGFEPVTSDEDRFINDVRAVISVKKESMFWEHEFIDYDGDAHAFSADTQTQEQAIAAIEEKIRIAEDLLKRFEAGEISLEDAEKELELI